MKLNKLSNFTFDWKKINWLKIAPYVVALAVFIGIALMYCSPILEGKVVHAGDTLSWQGAAHQTQEYRAQTGESCWWTNSMFSGMPTYQVDAHIPSHQISHGVTQDVLHAWMPETIGIIFGYFLGFFILLLCFGINPWLSIAGSLAIGLSSYFFIIIPAGHVTKAVALGFLPAMIGGIHLIFNRKYLIGIPILLIYGMTGIVRHPQMTYYMAMLAGVMIIAELYLKIRNKAWKELGISIAICIACMLLIGGTKICYFKLNNEYVKETMRGEHSELTKAGEKSKENAPRNKKAGLDIDYATQWSYGIDETMTLLIPNWEGCKAPLPVDKNSALYKDLIKHRVSRQDAESVCKLYIYHGNKPGTGGAVYVGAIVCFLFLLGLLIVPGPYKWALLFATLMSIFLAWGKNMMWFTEFFFNYFPMYNKFRAVESILVVAEITMPLLGFMGLQRILSGEVEWKKLRHSLFIAGGLTAGFCLVAALFTSSFNMSGTNDAYFPDWLQKSLVDARTALAKADAWRSFLFVMAGFIAVYGYAWMQHSFGNKTKYKVALIAALIGLILGDMIPVNKRFFNDDNFVTPKENQKYFAMQPWEEEIAKDKDPDFRVLNLAADTYNDSRTSYRFKSIGGYSAVKLRRYQDLIDAHISQEINAFKQTVFRTNGFYEPDPKNGAEFPVLNMLNTRYAVIGLRDGSSAPIQNPYAMGNAWFVDNVQFVPTPDDESNALYSLDLHTTAVADEKFRNVLSCEANPSAMDDIQLVKFTPNKLTYEANTAADRVAVFSEIYYPHGWHLYIDGQEAQIGRVNYVLRAAVIPAGEHTITMEFVPDGLKWDNLSYASVWIILLISLGCIGWSIWRSIKQPKIPIKQ